MYIPRIYVDNINNNYECVIEDPSLDDGVECHIHCANENEVYCILIAFVCILSDQYWEGYDDGFEEASGGGDIDLL